MDYGEYALLYIMLSWNYKEISCEIHVDARLLNQGK